MAAGRRQRDLRRGADRPVQRVGHRFAKVDRQIGGLVEASRMVPRPVQRHRHQQVCALKEVARLAPKQRGQWRRQLPSAAVLEGMNDEPKRPIVRSHGSGLVHGGARLRARRAAALAAPWRQRDAASGAQRWGEDPDGSPAVGADGAAGRLVEQVVAGGAARSDQRRQQRVGHLSPRRRRPVGVLAARTSSAFPTGTCG